MHNTLNFEADWLQQQVALLSAKNEKLRLKFAQGHQN